MKIFQFYDIDMPHNADIFFLHAYLLEIPEAKFICLLSVVLL